MKCWWVRSCFRLPFLPIKYFFAGWSGKTNVAQQLPGAHHHCYYFAAKKVEPVLPSKRERLKESKTCLALSQNLRFAIEVLLKSLCEWYIKHFLIQHLLGRLRKKKANRLFNIHEDWSRLRVVNSQIRETAHWSGCDWWAALIFSLLVLGVSLCGLPEVVSPCAPLLPLLLFERVRVDSLWRITSTHIKRIIFLISFCALAIYISPVPVYGVAFHLLLAHAQFRDETDHSITYSFFLFFSKKVLTHLLFSLLLHDTTSTFVTRFSSLFAWNQIFLLLTVSNLFFVSFLYSRCSLLQ